MPKTSRRAALLTSLLTTSLAAGALCAAPAHALTGSATTAQDYAFTARLVIGDGERACSGALVDPSWVISAAWCFTEDADSGAAPPAGEPTKTVSATVGRTDLTTTAGLVTTVTELVSSPGRDMVMAHLAKPATGVTPVTLSTTAPTAGDILEAAGFGRTATEWSPTKQHIGSFSVDSVDDSQLSLTGRDGASICAGDAGGPLLREVDGTVELVGVSTTRSWQAGCWGTDESEQRNGAAGTRVDDVNAWVQQVRGLPQQAQTVAGDFDGDGMTTDGRTRQGLWNFTSTGNALAAPHRDWDSAL